MFSFPTIFDWLERLDFLRGEPAAYLVLVAALIIVVIRDWRASILALAVQYLAGGLLFVDVLDPRLSIVKILVGLFICLILYFTCRQVGWGRLPEDISPEEAVQMRREGRLRFGRYLLPTSLPFRLLLGLLAVMVVLTLAGQSVFRLPIVPEHVNLAIYALAGLGLVALALSSEPLRAGLGLLTFLLGFELFYAALEQSVAMLAVLAALDLLLAVMLAYLIQRRHAIPALFDREVT
jgi:hypothetical protein